MIKRVATVISVAALALFLGARPASASWSGWCVGFGIVCMAEHTNGDGAHFTDSGPVGSCQSMPSGWNDRISSVNNHFQTSGGYVTFWWDGGCNGWRQSYGPLATVNNVGSFHNDEWSSFCIGPISGGGVNGCDRWFP